MKKLSNLVVIIGFFLSACGGVDTSYNGDWLSDETLGAAKADGLLDNAQELSFNETVTGYVGGQQMDIYQMQLLAGDKFTLVKTVEDGDLNPHISLYYGYSDYISSSSWDKTDNVLSKTYKVDLAGTYYLAIRAYQEEGSGNYSLVASCVGGPCAGEYPDPVSDLSREEVAECIALARKCAFEKMAQYNGAVGPIRANTLLEDCLEESSLDEGYSCRGACEMTLQDQWGNAEQAAYMCDDIKEGIIFYADQGEECLIELETCLDQCMYQAGNDYFDEVYDFSLTPISICWSTGFHGTCDSYARGHKKCGGQLWAEDTLMECYGQCNSIDGAWIDDLDNICDEACSYYFDDEETCLTAMEEDCRTICDDDESCNEDCVFEWSDYCYYY
jgi:hypothetical protein